jgi:hypothetical protein
MNRTHSLSFFTCCYAVVAMSLIGCTTPMPKPPLLIPMPSQGFLLTPPPERPPPKAELAPAVR